MQNKGTVPKIAFRKTSAEIIKEAQNSLVPGNGAKLVSTKRPITPNVNNRQLYGNSFPAGRPPSAFNLKYLQHEMRTLPCLEPINQSPTSSETQLNTISSKGQRSGSIGTVESGLKTTRLPALTLDPPNNKPSTTTSLNECKFDKLTYSLFIYIDIKKCYQKKNNNKKSFSHNNSLVKGSRDGAIYLQKIIPFLQYIRYIYIRLH